MSIIMEDISTMDYISITCIALPVIAALLCGYLFTQKKNDAMQHKGSKVSQNTKPSTAQLTKNDSSDSGLSSGGSPQPKHHNNGQSANGSSKHRKSRSNNNNNHGNHKVRQDVINAFTQKQPRRTTTATTAAITVNNWFGQQELVYCYESRYTSSRVEENIRPRHNAVHRNSTSSDAAASDVAASDAAASDDLVSSSSVEDLSTAYTIIPKENKKSTKSRQRRQQKRKQQQHQQHVGNNIDDIAMDIDEEFKENCRPPNDNNVNAAQQQQQQKSGANNLRKQCTKAAAFKQINKNTNTTSNASDANNGNKRNKNINCKGITHNTLISSYSNSSVSSTISSTPSSSTSNSPTNSANCSPTATPTITKRKTDNYKKIARALTPKLHHDSQYYMSESELIHNLRHFIIDPNLLRVYGYPVESAIHEGCIEIYKCIPKQAGGNTWNPLENSTAKTDIINTNDGLYINFGARIATDACSTSVSDSGQGSSDSSPPSIDSDAIEVGEDESTGIAAFYTPDGTYQVFSHYDQSLEKQCVRCKKHFHVTQDGEYLHREECVFHWGKLNHSFSPGKGYYYQYTCCQGEQYDSGCTMNELHVWTGAVVGLNGPYVDFVHTIPRSDYDCRPRKMYALDCEMSFTGRGLEVTKVTVVAYNGELVYEHFVRPDADIVDYNTRFSGITENDLSPDSNTSVKTLQEVQQDLLQLFDADTILIGHGLDNDLRVLRIVHKTIIDTSISFPHTSGFPYRRSLKHIAKMYLHRDIQCSQSGHSSFEDAKACMDVMVWKACKECFTPRY